MMKNTLNICLSCTAFAVALVMLSACTDKASTGKATVEVRLTDAPAEYQEVNIDIQDVQVHAEGGDPNSGWQSLSIRKGVYNLLTLTNGLDTLLGATTLPPGKISQVRLVLGSNNSIKVNNASGPLATPSAQQSGLKIQVDAELKDGITYKITLDFDAARSIVATGSGKYNLKPVIRAITTAQRGAIKGAVTPATALPVVYAINGADTVSTYTNTSGLFLVKGLAPASYRLVLVAKSGATVEKSGVVVTTGNVTDVGSIAF
jgi:hypothetical protein